MLYTLLAALTLSTPALSAGAHDAASVALLRALRVGDRPGIRLWTMHDEVYQRGDRVRLYFRTERDAFVTIFRADTDGRVRVLYPRDPWDENLVRGGATYTVSGYRRGEAFVVDDDAGVGYVFGIASTDPFDYEAIVREERWDLHTVAERIHGDPYASLMELVDNLMPDRSVDYDTHLLPYYVERRYDYPRFVCYDCHNYVSYAFWNPYSYVCRRYSMFVYNDPFYFYPSYWYPTRYYGGTRVVYVRPRDAAGIGRYVFKDRQPSQPPIVYRRRTDTAGGAGAAPADRGVRGRDLGGVGTIGIPGNPSVPVRRRVDAPSGGSGGAVAPSDPPVIRGSDGGRRAVVDPGVTPMPRPEPVEPGRGVVPITRPGRGEPTPLRPVLPEDRPVNRGVTPAHPKDVPATDGVRRGTSTRPSESPGTRGEPARREAPRSEPRATPAPAPRNDPPPRSEPRASPPPRSEPAPRSQPAPQSEPAPRLERRRPER